VLAEGEARKSSKQSGIRSKEVSSIFRRMSRPMGLYGLYQERYRGEMKFKTSPKGLHSAIVAEIAKDLPGRTVLDIGCGAGRLSIYCASHGANVTGIDFSDAAIELANLITNGLTFEMPNLKFRVDQFERVEGRYDVVLITEVFEHIEQQPVETLKRLRELVAPGGKVVVSCPGFVNFRGVIWMTLQNLFGFLMSPSDVHFVFPWQMLSWCMEAGLQIEKEVGLFYDWGWGDWAASDMKQRIRFALRDQRKSDPSWEQVSVNLEKMDGYLDSQAAFFEQLLRQNMIPLLGEVPTRVLGTPLTLRDELLATDLGVEIQDYLADARVGYSNQAPLNKLGATNLYFCQPL